MTEHIRVLITDDHEVVREGLRMILETEDDFEVVGIAVDGVEAVAQVDALQPDVVLMDLRMPRMDGIEAIERIRSDHPEIAVVILTTYDEDDLMLRGLQAGASGFLHKDTPRIDLFKCLRAAARGDVLLSPEVLVRVMASPMGKRPAAADEDVVLTLRELEVLEGVAAGERNKEIAYR
ncbi:MAG: response regulator transcription factor, partial [Anaerolineales bacterium]|nr:response regulator transcription factor [Anaerolineales bacterium]